MARLTVRGLIAIARSLPKTAAVSYETRRGHHADVYAVHTTVKYNGDQTNVVRNGQYLVLDHTSPAVAQTLADPALVPYPNDETHVVALLHPFPTEHQEQPLTAHELAAALEQFPFPDVPVVGSFKSDSERVRYFDPDNKARNHNNLVVA